MRRYGILFGFLLLMLAWLGSATVWAQDTEPAKTKDRPSISLLPEALDFGEVLLGENAWRTVTILSDGKDEADLEILRLNGDRDFILLEDRCSGRELDPRQRCDLLIGFTPGEGGERVAELLVIDDDNVLLGRLLISGQGVAPLLAQPVLVVASPVDFDELAVGLVTEKSLLIQNQGSAPLNIGQIGLGVPFTTPFSLTGDLCSGRSVPPGGNCSLQITFAPTAAGDFGQEFDIPSNDPQRNPVLVRLQGVAVAPPPAPLPRIRVRDSSPPDDDRHMDFGMVTVGARVEHTLTLRNEGEGVLEIGALHESSLSRPFTIDRDDCSGQRLQPGGECKIRILYHPLDVGAFTENLSISSNDPTGPVAVSLSGSATALPEARLEVADSIQPIDDLSLPFGAVGIGQLIEQTVTLRNTGNAPLRLGAIAAAQILNQPFAVADPCSNQSLPPQGVCTLRITFAPTAADSFNDVFDIPFDAGEPVIFAVSGSGTASALPRIAVTDSLPPLDDQRLAFGEVTIGRTVEATVTIANIGTAELRIGQLPAIGAPFLLNVDQCSQEILPVGDSCLLLVAFAPTGTTAFERELVIPSNDPGQPQTTLALTGRGLVSGVNQPPLPPRLLSPGAGQQDLGLLVTLRWEQSRDPDGDPIHYRVRWSTDQDFATAEEELVAAAGIFGVEAVLLASLCGVGILRRSRAWPLLLLAVLLMTAWSCSSDTEDGALVSSWQLRELNPATTYYWQVLAEDDRGAAAESEIRSFTTGRR